MKCIGKIQKVMMSSIIMIITTVSSFSQVNVHSPSATEIVRHERIPVSYFNGLPSIDIPLYTIQSKDITFPLSLSYHASGIKVNQYPTMVGLGWNMNLGAITRVVNGLPDETCGKDIADSKGMSYNIQENTGYYYSSGFMDREDWASEQRLIDHYISSQTLKYDIEPDEFVINAYGLSGSIFFYRDSYGTVHSKIKSNNGEIFKVESHTIQDNPECIVFHGNDSDTPLTSYRIHKLFKEFTVVKNDGTKLVFGGGDDYIEFYTEKRSSENGTSYMKTWPSAWLLKEIISPKGNRISFKYRRDGNPVIMSDVRTDVWTVDYASGSSNQSPVTDPDRGKSFIIQHPLYPLRITSDDGLEIYFSTAKDKDLSTVTEDDVRYLNITGFNPELSDKICYSKSSTSDAAKTAVEPHDYSHKLTKIDVSHKGKVIKALTFRYIESTAERLKLDMLNIGNAAGSSEQTYYFEYDNGKLPPYNSTVTDNWGYWNNKNYRNGISKEDFFDYRSADVSYTKAETLTKIIYPTGGYVTLDYELNDYSKIATQAPEFNIVESSGTAGGLRIRQIKHHTDTTEYIHSFEYKNIDGSSSGILSGIPVYVAEGGNHESLEYVGWQGLTHFSIKSDINQRYLMESESYINTLGLTTGNHVTYSRVIESVGSTVPLRKEYHYTNHDSHPDTADYAMYTNIDNVALHNKFTSRALMRGLLTNEIWYNGNIKVKETINRYNSNPSRFDEYMNCIDLFSLPGQQNNPFYLPFVRYAPYKILTFYPYIESRTEKIYDPTGTVVISSQEEQYTYNNSLLLKKKVRKNSKGEWETTTVTYPDEYSDRIHADMQERNQVSYPVETTTSNNGKITSSSLNEYKEVKSNILPGKTWKLNISESIDSTEFTRYSTSGKDSHYILDSEVIDYDKYGNPLQICDNQGIHTSYIWGHEGLYPTVQITDAVNTYYKITETTPQEKTERIELLPSNMGANVKTYTFRTNIAGDVTFTLVGGIGYDWFVEGRLDTSNFALVQLRSDQPINEPWDGYSSKYTYSVTFTNIPAGVHTLSIITTSVRAGNMASGENGSLTYSYQTADIHVSEEGMDEFLYEDFEDKNMDNIFPFGYNSSSCLVGKYEVNLKGNSDRKYTMDYRVYKDGKWDYVRTDIDERYHVIDEGVNPIDDVRVYPADADIQTFSWKPYIGMRSRSNSAGITESYDFDRFGRLETVRNNNNDIIRSYKYNYVSSSLSNVASYYYNEAMSMSFGSSLCDTASGYHPIPVEYAVPAGKYTSEISQDEANILAFNDLITNGQAYADAYGICQPHIAVSVYNTLASPVTIQCILRKTGVTTEKFYTVPSSRQIGTSGIPTEDYVPVTVYLPRENYLYVRILNEDMEEISFISEFGHIYGFMYSEDNYPQTRDTYIIR